MQKTFSIIKPDAVKRNLIGHINQMIESADLKILAKIFKSAPVSYTHLRAHET